MDAGFNKLFEKIDGLIESKHEERKEIDEKIGLVSDRVTKLETQKNTFGTM